MPTMDLPPEVQQIVDQHKPHFSVTAEGKIKCELNGHTLPPRADALNAFVNGKKYGKLVKAAEVDAGLTKYEPFIVRSRNFPGMLFCALTGELLNARLNEVKQHLKGKKFGRAKERFAADEQELLEEPDMAELEDDDEDMEDGEGPGVWIPEEVAQEYEMGEAEGGEGEEGEEQQQAEEEGAAAAAANGSGKPRKGGKGGKGSGGGDGGEKRQKQQRQQEGAQAGGQPPKKQQKPAAGSGKGKQQQQQQRQPRGAAAASNGSGGKAKAPKAKKARTG